jgi:hypothetical protein
MLTSLILYSIMSTYSLIALASPRTYNLTMLRITHTCLPASSTKTQHAYLTPRIYFRHATPRIIIVH